MCWSFPADPADRGGGARGGSGGKRDRDSSGRDGSGDLSCSGTGTRGERRRRLTVRAGDRGRGARCASALQCREGHSYPGDGIAQRVVYLNDQRCGQGLTRCAGLAVPGQFLYLSGGLNDTDRCGGVRSSRRRDHLSRSRSMGGDEPGGAHGCDRVVVAAPGHRLGERIPVLVGHGGGELLGLTQRGERHRVRTQREGRGNIGIGTAGAERNEESACPEAEQRANPMAGLLKTAGNYSYEEQEHPGP